MITAAQVTEAFTGFSTDLAPILVAGTVATLGLMFVIMGPKKVIGIIKGMFRTT